MSRSIRGKTLLAVIAFSCASVIVSLVVLNRGTATNPPKERIESTREVAVAARAEDDVISVDRPEIQPKQMVVEPSTPTPAPTRRPVTPQELAEATRLATRLQKEFLSAAAKVQEAERAGGPFFQNVINSKVYSIEEIMKGIALARALRDPVLGPSIAAILRREASLFDAQIMYQAIVAPAKLDPALMSRPMTPQRFEALVQQADVLLQAEYAALAGKLQLEREVLQNADTMFSSKALLRLVTMDMAERGYSWSDESLQFTPSKKVRRQANP